MIWLRERDKITKNEISTTDIDQIKSLVKGFKNSLQNYMVDTIQVVTNTKEFNAIKDYYDGNIEREKIADTKAAIVKGYKCLYPVSYNFLVDFVSDNDIDLTGMVNFEEQESVINSLALYRSANNSEAMDKLLKSYNKDFHYFLNNIYDIIEIEPVAEYDLYKLDQINKSLQEMEIESGVDSIYQNAEIAEANSKVMKLARELK